MFSNYNVIGKVSKVKDEIKKEKYSVNKKHFFAFALGIVFSIAYVQIAHATGYETPKELAPLSKFGDKIIWIMRWVGTIYSGIKCSYAGFAWLSAKNGEGKATAKMLLHETFWGCFWLFFGYTIANFGVKQMYESGI